MKKALFTIGALIVLIAAAIGIEKLYCDNSILYKKTTITNTETGNGRQNVEISLPPSDEGGLDDRQASSPDPQNNHEGNQQSHVIDSFFGFKISDIIAFFAALSAIVFAGWGIRQNRLSNEIQNRAYVTVDGCNVKSIPNGIQVEIILKNVGATPATNIHLTHWFGCSREYNERLPREGNVAQPMTEGNFMLGPSDKKVFLLPMVGANMPDDILVGLLSGEWNLLFDGELYYSDEFGGRHEILYHFRKRLEHNRFIGKMSFGLDGLQYRRV